MRRTRKPALGHYLSRMTASAVPAHGGATLTIEAGARTESPVPATPSPGRDKNPRTVNQSTDNVADLNLNIDVDTLADRNGDLLVEVTSLPQPLSLDEVLNKAYTTPPEAWEAKDREITTALGLAQPVPTGDAGPTRPRARTFTVRTAEDIVREADALDAAQAGPDLGSPDTQEPTGAPATTTPAPVQTPPRTAAATPSPTTPRRPTQATTMPGLARTLAHSISTGLKVAFCLALLITTAAAGFSGYEWWHQDRDTTRYCTAAPALDQQRAIDTIQALANARPTGSLYLPFRAGADAFAPTSQDLAPDVDARRRDLSVAYQELLATKRNGTAGAAFEPLAVSLVDADNAFRGACAPYLA